MIDSIVKTVRGIVKLRGNTDNTLIGNFGDRCKVAPSTRIEEHTSGGRTFRVSTNLITFGLSNNETPVLLITNPNGSGKTLKLNSLNLFTDAQAGGNYDYKWYITPTITSNGTAITAVGSKQTSQNSSVCSFYKSPTISANGTFIDIHTIGTDAASKMVSIGLGAWLEPNNSWLFNVQWGGSQKIGMTIEFIEE